MNKKNRCSNVAAFEHLKDQKSAQKNTSSISAINDTELGKRCQAKPIYEILENGKKMPPIERVTSSGTDIIKILDSHDFASVIPNFKPFTELTAEDRFMLLQFCRGNQMPERGDDPVCDELRAAQDVRILRGMLDAKYFTALRLAATCNGATDISRRCCDIQEKTGAVIVSMRPIDLVRVGIIKPVEAVAECKRNRYYLIGESLDETAAAWSAYRFGDGDTIAAKKIVSARNKRIRALIQAGPNKGAA